ncbi:hypothetical protein CC86DRAFT_430869 [Ophiobolus disseminans]|uniref:non-specific serine/threonine protein kinase n=1 Tax=Ophiobolus disseminans TaxID=1469910 RepID=A0A6A7AEP3_9PLEO|nr:hypothetical protein CC86DRAFT_430869 [Ophiobolus disseminans]
MLENNAILKLKRSHSDVDTLVPMGELTPPNTPDKKTETPITRPSRAFSWSKLTMPIKGKGPSSRSSRASSSAGKRPTISSPILDPRQPLCPPTPKDTTPSPTVSSRPTAQSSPGPRPPATLGLPVPESTHTAQRHSYSSSDPTAGYTPHACPRPPSRAPPPIPRAPSSLSVTSTLDSPLECISESQFEHCVRLAPLQLERLDSWFSKMEPMRLEPTRLQPPNGGTKYRAMQEAKQMEELVAERAKRAGEQEPPPYDFYELIGKGAYGRVYKGKNRDHGGLVAIKIIDIDNQDYQEMTTENLAQTIKEIDILQQLKNSKARPYVNIIEEARTVHNELWIVSEYASGGSVNTLMKPTHAIKDPGPGLPEKFIIPIARELALGLKYVHEAGVIHRDLKTNNVLILEDGRVQLCDFGVSGTLEPQKSKRTTIVGTPAWMAPELQQEWVKDADPRNPLRPIEIHYGNEIDIWAYGCTIHEMASGFPPHHRINQLELPNAGAPELEDDRFSQELKDFLAFVFQPDPKDRPTADQILEHPYLAGSTKLYPTFTLVKLVEEYYRWEQSGGARASLFNPYGAQAPDPLSMEDDDDDDNDWSFSTTEEFEQEHAPQFADPFAAPGQGFAGMNIPPMQDMGRFEQLQARFKEESIVRGQKRLNKLFDTSTTPYRYSMVESEDSSTGRPPSDLALREFNPGVHRETVIDLDFSLPSTEEPNIDLGEVPTIKANRMKSILREMEEEEERDALIQQEEELTKRATKDWKSEKRDTMAWSFPSEQPNRKTMEWSFPSEPAPAKRETMEWSFAAAQPQKPNRRTVEWTFDAAMAEGNYDAPRNRTSRRRETQDWKFPKADDSRKTQDFSFPMRSPAGSQNGHQASNSSSSPTLAPGFRPSLRYAATMPVGEDDFPRVSDSPESPLRTSMIDLDMAMVESYRPSTSGSDAIHTAGTVSDNPFNLEDQVQLSQNNHRASYHFQSKSEPNQTVPGLLTPQQQDEQGHAHARGVSSASQVQAQKPLPKDISSAPQHHMHRPSQRSQQIIWDGWSHSHAYGLGSDDQSPPMSVTTDTSLEDEDVDDLWDAFERTSMQSGRRMPAYAPLRSARRTDSQFSNLGSVTLDSESDDPNYPSYSSDSDYPVPMTQAQHYRKSRVSAGPNGRPLVDFPVPRGVEVEQLLGVEGDARHMAELLLKSAVELRDGTRAGRDLLRAMRLEEVAEENGDEGVSEGMGMGVREVDEEDEDGNGGTVRLVGRGSR